jgi:hypothetical protein
MRDPHGARPTSAKHRVDRDGAQARRPGAATRDQLGRGVQLPGLRRVGAGDETPLECMSAAHNIR